MSNDIMSQFDPEGKAETAEPVSNLTPSIKMHDEDGLNIGKYVSGRLLSTRKIVKNGTNLMFIEVRLESTNAKATVKKGNAYVEAQVTPGQLVSVYASSRLFRSVEPLAIGSRVLMTYEGQRKVETPKGRKLAHIYDVKHLPGVLSDEDLAHLKARAARKNAVKDVEASQKESEVEAEAALSQLED